MVKRRTIALAIAMLVLNVVAIAMLALGGPTSTADAAVKTLFWKGVFHVDEAINSDRNLDAIHAKPENYNSLQCIACHGDMETAMPESSSTDDAGTDTTGSAEASTASSADEASSAASATALAGADASEVPSATSNVKIDVHFHMGLEVASFTCTDCHRTDRVWNVETTATASSDSSGTLTTTLRTNRFFCFKCHSSFDTYVEDGTMQAEWEEEDCKMCHTGKLAPRHEQTFLNQVLSSNECLMCHGNNLFPWPEQHYEDSWSTTHGLYAADRSTCSICHATESFCNDCHKIKPSTHTSAWRGLHQAAYKKRPSRCATCHTKDYCNNTCHLVNHTKNWKDHHGPAVQEQGRDYCMDCHYLGFCIKCHDSSGRSVSTIDFGSETTSDTGGQ